MTAKIPFSTRLSLSLEICFSMFLCSAAIAVAQTWQSGKSDSLAYAVALGVPAVAWLGFVVVACAIPSLLAPGKLSFPLNVTLPVVYTGLTALVHGLVMRSGSSLTATNSRLAPAEIWGQTSTLAMALVVQVVLLSVFVSVARAVQRDLESQP